MTLSGACWLDLPAIAAIQSKRVEWIIPRNRASTGDSCCAGRPSRRPDSARRGARGMREHDDADRRRDGGRATSEAAAELVVAKPLGPAGLPLPRPDNSVTWAITDDNKPIADGVKPEAGPLRIYNYADYVDPATVKKFQQQFNTKVQVATYNSSDEAIAKLASGAVAFDLIMGLSGSNMVDLIARKLLKPLNHSYLPEPREEHLARAGRPVLRPRRALHGPVRRLDGRHRLAQRQGQGGRRGRWTSRGTSSGGRRPTAARSGILDDRRDALSMPMQRDAMQQATSGADLNTEDKARGRQGAAATSRSSARSATRRSRSPTTRRCPKARRCCTTRGRATCSAAAFYYMPKGVPPSRALVLGARPERRRAERLLLHRQDGEEPGARARVHQLLPRREERLRQLRQLHRATPRRRRTSTRTRCSSAA